MSEINGISDSTGIVCLAQTLWYTGTLQVIFAKYVYAVTLSLQAKHNTVQRATRERMQQVPSASHPFQSKQENLRCSSKDNKIYVTAVAYTICTKRMKRSSYYSSLKVKHLLESWLAEGFRFPRCFVKVEWTSPTTERSVTTWTTGNTDIIRAHNALKVRSACSEVSFKENAAEETVFSRACIFWHFELKPEIFHPHKNNYKI